MIENKVISIDKKMIDTLLNWYLFRVPSGREIYFLAIVMKILKQFRLMLKINV